MFRIRQVALASLISVAYCPLVHEPAPTLFVSQAEHVALSCTPRELGVRCDRDGSIGPTCCAEHPRREPKRRLRYA